MGCARHTRGDGPGRLRAAEPPGKKHVPARLAPRRANPPAAPAHRPTAVLAVMRSARFCLLLALCALLCTPTPSGQAPPPSGGMIRGRIDVRRITPPAVRPNVTD